MPYLAFWPFPRPANDEDARDELERLRGERGWEPLPLLVDFVKEVTTRYPDLDDDGHGVWGDRPLLGDIRGNLLHVQVRERVDEVVSYLVARALTYHLNVFDVTQARMLTSLRRRNED